MAIHTGLRSDPIHLQDDHGLDSAVSQGCERIVGGPHGTLRIPPHHRPLPQVKTEDDILGAYFSTDLGDLVGSCARLRCQDNPRRSHVEQPTRIRLRTDPCVDQQLNAVNATGKGCHESEVISRLFEGIQIRHIDLQTPQGRVECLQQDHWICAGDEATLYRPVSVPVAVLRVDCGPSSNVEHRDEAHGGRILARP